MFGIYKIRTLECFSVLSATSPPRPGGFSSFWWRLTRSWEVTSPNDIRNIVQLLNCKNNSRCCSEPPAPQSLVMSQIQSSDYSHGPAAGSALCLWSQPNMLKLKFSRRAKKTIIIHCSLDCLGLTIAVLHGIDQYSWHVLIWHYVINSEGSSLSSEAITLALIGRLADCVSCEPRNRAVNK